MSANATRVEIASPEEMQHFGEQFALQLRAGDVVLLHGDLGAGKTTLTQGILRGLGVRDPVTSPTFVLVAEYAGHVASGEPVMIRHVDLYRLADPAELDSIGFSDIVEDPDGILIVEWPERAGAGLPDAYILVTFHFSGPGRRLLELSFEPKSRAITSLTAFEDDSPPT